MSLLIIGLAASFACATPPPACTCAPARLAESPADMRALVARTHAVFEGRVSRTQVRIGADTLGGGYVSRAYVRVATVQLLESWKGVAGNEVTVVTPADVSACGADLRLGQSYLFFATQAAEGAVAVDSCLAPRPSEVAASLRTLLWQIHNERSAPPREHAFTLPVVAPAQDVVGTWRLVLALDELNGEPAGRRARSVEGEIAISMISVDSAIHSPGEYLRTLLYGRFDLDLTRLGQDIVPRWSEQILREATEAFVLETGDSVQIDLGTGLIWLSGRLAGDGASGEWGIEHGNASGTFLMTRITADPPVLAIRPKPPPPPPLDTARMGRVRVRVWDPTTNEYVKTRHAFMSERDGWSASYDTGTDPEGWGVAYWKPPGEYAVEFSRLPCGDEEWFLAEPVVQSFRVEIGRTTSVTVTIDRRRIATKPSYDNPDGRLCDK